MRQIFRKLLARKQEPPPFGMLYPPGHYYSPIPDREEISRRAVRIFDRDKRTLPGIELNEDEQFSLLKELSRFYGEQPFPHKKTEGIRYYFDNVHFCQSDAIFLYSMLRHFRPNRVVEVGSGFSSAVMLDTNDLFLDGNTDFTFIEPYADRLKKLLTDTDRATEKSTIIERFVQDVDLSVFDQLEKNDILFIDSSHVGKVGSDVLHILFEILPRLNSGVLIHFHDVFYPFEYPDNWIMQGRVWNEDYYLRAFLSYNSQFEVVVFNTFLAQFYEEWFQINMPICLENTGGSLWLRKC